MLSSRRQERVKSGAELREALCAACGNDAPQTFDHALLNTLLDFSRLPRDDPRKDPLELKQLLGSVNSALGKLSLRQRKAMDTALDAQTASAKKLGLPDYFHVEGGWPPKQPEPEPARSKPAAASSALMLSPTPPSGEGDGFTWTQTETELTITVHVPENTQKQEVLMQVVPKFGPAQQIAIRAKFWPLPLVSGTLHAPIDASEATWHLDTNSKITIDLPKIEEKLWPGTPPVFTDGPGPLADYQMPALPASSDDVATGGSALVASVAPETIVQKMGQRPNDLPAQMHGCALLCELVEADPGKCLGAANARAIPVLLRLLRFFGHQPEVQLAAWRTLITMVEAQSFLRKILVESNGMKLILAGLEAHRADEAVLTQLAIGCRTLLPATPPRLFVEAAGLELLVESLTAHPTAPLLGEVAGGCLHMLSGVNNIIRRMILRMEALAPLLSLCGANETRQSLHEVTMGLVLQLSKGDTACAQLYTMQIDSAKILELMRRFPSAVSMQADGARTLASLLTNEQAVLDLISHDGITHLLGAAMEHGEDSAVGNEVTNALEQAVCAMCDAAGKEAPDEEFDNAQMGKLLSSMAEAALERGRLAAEAKKNADDEARAAAEAAEAARRLAESAEKARVEEAEAAAPQYSGFSWGSSFDDPRLYSGMEEAPQAPRIVELDD